MLDEKTKQAIHYIAKRKKYEELLEEKERLEDELMKERTGVSNKELERLKRYFQKKEWLELIDSKPSKYKKSKSLLKVYMPYQRVSKDNAWEESCPTIEELKKRDSKKKLYRQYKRIKL